MKPSEKPGLSSLDLLLRPADQTLAAPVLDYYVRNKDFLTAFEPTRSNEFYSLDFQRQDLKKKEVNAAEKSGYQFYISALSDPDRIIGAIALSNIVWGSFKSCFLGYKLDQLNTGRGFMTQAVNACTEYAFGTLHLHRIEANVMPRNLPSLRVLQKCGYEEEGLAKQYLQINGIWEDHIHMVKLVPPGVNTPGGTRYWR